MSSPSNENLEWDFVQKDLLVGASRRAHEKLRQRQVLWKANAILALIFVVGWGTAGVWMPQRSSVPNTQSFTCEDVEQNLQKYLSKTLEPGLNRLFEAHLKECSRCQRMVQGFRAAQDENQPLPRSLTGHPLRTVARANHAPTTRIAFASAQF